MGIFPTSFAPKHMKRIVAYDIGIKAPDDYLPEGCLKDCILSTYEYWHKPEQLEEIDKWVKDNSIGTVYFCERWPEGREVWTCYFYFTEEADCLAFKLMWKL